MLRSTILSVFLLFQLPNYGQSLTRIEKFIEKEEYDKFKDLLDKSEEKDSTRIGVKYYFSKYFSAENKPFFNIDSAAYYIQRAITLYNSASNEVIEELKSDGINEQIIVHQEKIVHQLAFRRAKEILTLNTINDFIDRFENAQEYPQAILLRDSLAFEQTRLNPSAKNYLQYIKAYPQSAYNTKAQAVYDSLSYIENTNPQNLKSLENFLIDYPKSPYKKLAISQIYKLSTTIHELSNYLQFIKRYPTSPEVRLAANFAYHLNKLATLEALAEYPITDSLKSSYRLEQGLLYPFLDRNEIGFFSASGGTVLNPQFSEISDEIKCEGLSSVVFTAKDKDGTWSVYNRAGIALISNVVPSSLQILDQQVFSVTHERKSKAFHLSGKLLVEGFEKLELINSSWLVATKNSRKSLFNFQGASFITDFESVEREGPFYIFHNQDDLFPLNDQSLLNQSALSEIQDLIPIDDYEVSNNHLIIFKGDKEALIDDKLTYREEWGDHEIYFDYNQWVVKTEDSFKVLDPSISNGDISYRQILSNAGWLALKNQTNWSLKSRKNLNAELDQLDSIFLMDEYAALIFKSDSSYLLYQNSAKRTLQEESKVTRLPGAQGLAHHYIQFKNETGTVILDSIGNEYEIGQYDHLFVIGKELFRFSQKGKVGLINLQGEVVLKPIYDIAEMDQSLIYLLSKSVIGAYDARSKVLIEPKYDQKVELLGNGYLAKKGDEYLWLNANNSNQLKKSYEEMKSWNDTAVWVKDDLYWRLITNKDETILSGVSSFNKVISGDQNHIYAVHKDGKYALYSTKKGAISDFIFNAVLSVGETLIFCEQKLDLAGYFVVTYFSGQGNKVISQAYKERNYEQIWCNE